MATAERSRRLQSYIDLEGVIDGPLSSSQGTDHGYTEAQPPSGQLPPPHLTDHTPNRCLLQRMTGDVKTCSSSKSRQKVAGAQLKTVPLIGAFCRQYLGMSRDTEAWTDDKRRVWLPPAYLTDNTAKCGLLQRVFGDVKGCSSSIQFNDHKSNCGLLQAVLGHGMVEFSSSNR